MARKFNWWLTGQFIASLFVCGCGYACGVAGIFVQSEFAGPWESRRLPCLRRCGSLRCHTFLQVLRIIICTDKDYSDSCPNGCSCFCPSHCLCRTCFWNVEVAGIANRWIVHRASLLWRVVWVRSLSRSAVSYLVWFVSGSRRRMVLFGRTGRSRNLSCADAHSFASVACTACSRFMLFAMSDQLSTKWRSKNLALFAGVPSKFVWRR